MRTRSKTLAARLGIGSRHLLRLFPRHVGASPIAVAQTRRLHFAVCLLEETSLPITQIAMAAGFGSCRRFNDAFRHTYRRAPRELRRRAAARRERRAHGEEVVLRLAYRPPYDWAHMRDFSRRAPSAAVERSTRAAMRARSPVGAVTRWCASARCPARMRSSCASPDAPPAALLQLSSAARRVFDLAARPAAHRRRARRRPLIGPLVRQRPGLRIPGAWEPFECAVRAVLGQQVSVAAGRTLATRLVAPAAGTVFARASQAASLICFPTPRSSRPRTSTGSGITRSRAATLHALARAVTERRIDFSAAPEDVIAALAALPGIGPWTAQYVALRALGEPDALP